MAFIKNCVADPKELEKKIRSIEIGEEVKVDEETTLKLEGNLYGSDAFPDGVRIQTSAVDIIRREDNDIFVAKTLSGNEYEFGFTRHYGMPALNEWSFPDNDSELITFDNIKQIKRKWDGLGPIHIRGKSADVKDFKDGSVIDVYDVVALDSTENYPGVIAETKENERYLLPYDQRIGFYYPSIMIDWHLTFDEPDKKDEQKWKMLRETIGSMVAFSQPKDVDKDIFEKEEMIIPKDLKIRFASKKETTGIIEKLMSIKYKGSVRTYAIYGPDEDSMVQYDIFYIDRHQKKLMKKLKLDIKEISCIWNL